MTKEAYVSSISLSYYPGGKPSGGATIQFNDIGSGHTYITFNKEDAEKLFAICMEIFEKRKHAMAAQIEQIKFKPLLGYDKEKTIEANESF